MDMESLRKLVLDEERSTLTEWAVRRFPGIASIDWRDTNNGAGGFGSELIGFWFGLPIRIGTTSNGPNWGWLDRYCYTCQAYSGAPGVSFGLNSTASLFRLLYSDAEERAKATDECSSCEWLAEAKTAAARATTRFAAWRFKQLRNTTVEEVLNRLR